MRRIITFFLLFISVSVVFGAVQTDSIKVFFDLNRAVYNPSLNNNAKSMKKFIDGIIASASSGVLDRIDVYGYSSPEGPLLNNEHLAIQRCNAIADYISNHAGIPRGEIRTFPENVDWEGLRSLVIESQQTPARDAVLRVLSKHIPAASTDRLVSDQCLKDLRSIDNGHPYAWMLENLFPKLRCSLAIYSYSVQDRLINHHSDREITISDSLDSGNNDTLEYDVHHSIDNNTGDNNDGALSFPPVYRLALKTNLLYDAVLMPDLEVEWRINDNWSVALEGDVAWWGRYSECKSYRIVMVSPEVRCWFLTRGPWHGLYTGLFAGGGYYDFANGKRGYRGDGGMAGLSVGYMWPVSRCLSFEAKIGAGYLYTRCKKYIPFDECLVYQRTKNINYFGPLKVKFSLVWRLWDINKPKRMAAGIDDKRAI